MKIKELMHIHASDLNISEISVIRQTNLWNVCSHPNGRGFNGFLLLMKGQCEYTCDENKIKLNAGGLIYLPKGARHSVYAPERTLDFYRINFTVRDAVTSEEIIFSERPKLISDSASRVIADICEEMRSVTLTENNGFKNLSLLCRLLDFSIKASFNKHPKRIDAAIEYINEHYTEEIPISKLAELTYISEPHLFRLFKKELSVSPIEYKNELRIKKAEALLCDPECSIGEIALLLGFENACYFSRIFKMKRGISPIEYRAQANKRIGK